jgi:hypothetical protein
MSLTESGRYRATRGRCFVASPFGQGAVPLRVFKRPLLELMAKLVFPCLSALSFSFSGAIQKKRYKLTIEFLGGSEVPGHDHWHAHLGGVDTYRPIGPTRPPVILPPPLPFSLCVCEALLFIILLHCWQPQLHRQHRLSSHAPCFRSISQCSIPNSTPRLISMSTPMMMIIIITFSPHVPLSLPNSTPEATLGFPTTTSSPTPPSTLPFARPAAPSSTPSTLPTPPASAAATEPTSTTSTAATAIWQRYVVETLVGWLVGCLGVRICLRSLFFF